MLIADVPLGKGNTFYSGFGDWLGWPSLAGMIFFAVYMLVFSKKGKC
jgi:apolipoprotein N-acyltransferase